MKGLQMNEGKYLDARHYLNINCMFYEIYNCGPLKERESNTTADNRSKWNTVSLLCFII